MRRPRDTVTRERKCLDALWRFAFDADGAGGSHAWWKATLPGALEAAGPASYNDRFADAAAREHLGDVGYQTVRVPAGWVNGRIVLRLADNT